MCISAPKVNPAPPYSGPTIQTATDLNLAGQPRGAANLGRLQLRLIGNPNAAPGAILPANAPAASTPGAQSNPPPPTPLPQSAPLQFNALGTPVALPSVLTLGQVNATQNAVLARAAAQIGHHA